MLKCMQFTYFYYPTDSDSDEYLQTAELWMPALQWRKHCCGGLCNCKQVYFYFTVKVSLSFPMIQ